MTFDVWKQAKLMNGLEKIKTVSFSENRASDLDDIKRLAGISSHPTDGSNISITGNEKGELMKKHNIQPGTPEWFQLWFSKPYLTGEHPVDK